MTYEKIAIFRLNGLWQMVLREQFPECSHRDILKDIDVHQTMKDKNFSIDDYGEILIGLGRVIHGSSIECDYYSRPTDIVSSRV